MKVSREKAAENRERILDGAARLFRERGVQGVGVDALGEAAGLTHGSLYSQFGSKDRLLAEAVERAFSNFSAKYGAINDVDIYVDTYLSTVHRENVGGGCTMAALGSEMPRQSPSVRGIFTNAVKHRLAWLAALLPPREEGRREDDAVTMLATLVGAMILSRAVDDPELSQRILSVCREKLQSPGQPSGHVVSVPTDL